MAENVPTPKIMLVEDDLSMVPPFLRLVRPFAPVVHAATVAEGRRLLREEDLAGAFIDLHLPDGSGLDVATEARAFGQGIPCAVLTGNIDPDAIVHAGRLRALYLPKPAPPPTVMALVRRWIARRSRMSTLVERWVNRHSLLTSERRLLEFAVEGGPDAEFANARGLSTVQFKEQCDALLRKTGDASLARLAVRILKEALHDADLEI